MSGKPGEIEIRLPSQPKLLCVVRAAVGAVAGRMGFDESAVYRITLAVDEAMGNVIRHGYKNRDDGSIILRLSTESGNGQAELKIVVEDECEQVDPGKIKGRDLEDIRPGGLGVHLMRDVMDEVTFSKREPCGMRLVMRKALADGAG